MSNIKNLLWGIVLVAVGVIWGINTLGIANIDIFFDGWWTLFIIVPCFIDLFNPKEGKTGNLIGLVIGLLLLLSCQGLLDFSMIWRLFFPIVLIILGLSCVFKNIFNQKINQKIKELNKNKKDSKEYCATFSGQKLDFSDEQFTNCDLTAVFGGVDCDLRDAIIDKEAVINASAIFGGVTIKVPKDINVKVNSTSIFGGVDNKIKNKEDAKATIYINATCLFGGVELK